MMRKDPIEGRSTVKNDVTRAANIKDSKFRDRWANVKVFGFGHPSIPPKWKRDSPKSTIGPTITREWKKGDRTPEALRAKAKKEAQEEKAREAYLRAHHVPLAQERRGHFTPQMLTLIRLGFTEAQARHAVGIY